MKDIPVWTEHNKREAVYNKRLKNYLAEKKPKLIKAYKENGQIIKRYESR